MIPWQVQSVSPAAHAVPAGPSQFSPRPEQQGTVVEQDWPTSPQAGWAISGGV
jgi:hypothetical protein